MSGFYSKDFILESAFGQYHFSSIAVYTIATIGAVFTTLYSVKVLYLTFLASPNGPYNYYHTRDWQIINQSKEIHSMLLIYGNIIVNAALYVKKNMGMDSFYDAYDRLKEKINSFDTFEAIDPSILQSLLNEIHTVLWKELMYPRLSFWGYTAGYLENNFIEDTRKSINVAIENYSQDIKNSHSHHHANEGDLYMMLPLIILAVFSIFFGYITKDIFLGLGTGFFSDNSIFIHPNHEIMINTEFGVPTMFKLLPFGFTVIFSVLAIVFSEFLPESLIGFKFSRFGYNIFGFFNQRFLVDHFYNKYIVESILKLGGQTTRVLDKGAIELIGPFGLELGLIKLSKNIASLNTGVVTSYALYILVGMISYLTFNMFIAQIGWDFVLLVLLAGFSLMMSSIPSPSCPNPSTQARRRGSEGG